MKFSVARFCKGILLVALVVTAITLVSRGLSLGNRDGALLPYSWKKDSGVLKDDYHGGESDPDCERHVDPERPHVIVIADGDNLIGLVTLANSIVRNTEYDVMFHFVTYPSDATLLREWISGSVLKNINYEIVELSPYRLKGRYRAPSPRKALTSDMNFAKLLLTELLPCVGRVIFIDADCLVLGDIRELYDFKMADGDMIAGVNMLHFYSGRKKGYPTVGLVMNKTHPIVKQQAIAHGAGMMNAGVYLADLMQWEQHNISQKLQFWMELNTREPVFVYGDDGSGTQAVLMAIFHSSYTNLTKEWNTISGFHGTLNPKLIHWNGMAKPWTYPTTHFETWMKYYVADPTGHFKLTNKWKE